MPLARFPLVRSIVASLLCAPGWAQTTTRVSVDSAGGEANFRSGADFFNAMSLSLSADGRFTAFESAATNLVPNDMNSSTDIFVHDSQTWQTIRVSVDSNGTQANGSSHQPAISEDGRYVAFASDASNLFPGDVYGYRDVFVHDLQTGETRCASIDAGGYVGNGPSRLPSISADGRFVTFTSDAYTLWSGDVNGRLDVFVRDMQTSSTSLVSVDSNGAQGNESSGWSAAPSISSDGRYVAFESFATNFVTGDTNGTVDIFVHDRVSGSTVCASIGLGGAPASAASEWPSISADGRLVAFQSDANNLVPGDVSYTDIFVRDLQTGTTSRITANSGGSGGGSSYSPSISADGRYVAFGSYSENLVPGDSNRLLDVFAHEIQTGITSLASVNSSGLQGNLGSWTASLSADGQFVAFQSEATNLVTDDTNGWRDIFLTDRTCTGAVSTYCTAKTNSLGCVPSIGSVGLLSQSGPDNFYVTASNVRNNKLGMMLWSLGSANAPFFGGTLCLAQPIKRTPGQNSGGSPTGHDCTGTYAYHFTQGYMLQQLLGAHTTIYAQFWMRDPGFPPPNNIGLTNGLRFTICP